MLNFIVSFLTDITFSVKVNGHMPQKCLQENGVLQGSTLPVTLFLVAINSITEITKFSFKCSLIANNLNILVGGNRLNTQIFLQETIILC